jgi:hypothetical protein
MADATRCILVGGENMLDYKMMQRVIAMEQEESGDFDEEM